MPHWLHPQRLLCSGKTINRIEIIFPIKLTYPIPILRVYDENRTKEEIVEFIPESTSSSRAIFSANVSIKLNNKYLEFSMTRDCAIAIYLDKEHGE